MNKADLEALMGEVSQARERGFVPPIGTGSFFAKLAEAEFVRAKRLVSHPANRNRLAVVRSQLARVKAVLEGKARQIGCVGKELMRYPAHVVQERAEGRLIFNRGTHIEIYA